MGNQYVTEKHSGFEKLHAKEGQAIRHCRIFCLTMPKICQRNPSKFQKISDVQKLVVQEEDLTILLLKLFLLSLPKKFIGKLLVFQKGSDIEKLYV